MITENIKGKNTEIYTWPNPKFPFYYYLKHDKCRIFILENIAHNFEWLREIKNNIRPTDYFFVMNGWYASNHICHMSKTVLDHLGINKDQFIVMCNDLKELQHYLSKGFSRSILLNHNAWLNENLYKITVSPKLYNAILISRADRCKRLHLANKVQKLALITGQNKYGNENIALPKHINDNSHLLNTSEIVDIINKSYCGLCLSAEEGACYSSSEYLLCGIPVISTNSLGGRDIWYNDDNSIICQDTEDSVWMEVERMRTKKIDSANDIRNNHIILSKYFRDIFIQKTQEILQKTGVDDIDAYKYFSNTYIHKMKRFYTNKEVISFFKS